MKIFASSARRLAAVLAAFLLLTALWLFAWKKPLGRDNWFIAPRELWPSAAFLFPLGVLLLCGGFACLCAYDRFRRAKTRREEKTSLCLSLGALFLFAVLWPWALLGPRQIAGVYLISATWSDISNQYFSTAYRIENARDFTRKYETQQRNLDVTKSHVATHPPGAVLFYYAARKIYENVPLVGATFSAIAPGITAASTESVAQTVRGQLKRSDASDANAPVFPDDAVGSAIWCAFLLSLCVGLTVLAVYKLASGESSTRLGDNAANVEREKHERRQDERQREKRGLLGAILFAFAPSVGLFAFSLDALVMCLVAWSLVLLSRRLTSDAKGGIAAAFFGGALLGLATFVSFGALAVWGLVVFAFALSFGWRAFLTVPQFVVGDVLSRRKPKVHRPISDLALILLGFGAIWFVLILIFPMQIGAIYSRAMNAHHAATLTTRSYAGWALLNGFFFLLFCGWPLAVGFLRGAWRQIAAARTRQIVLWNAARLWGVAALLLCVALSLSGNVRGETERLWLFLVPPLCAFAATEWCAIEYSKGFSARFLTLITAFQVIQTLAMASTLAPLIRAY